MLVTGYGVRLHFHKTIYRLAHNYSKDLMRALLITNAITLF
jgi:hypothetical protein